MNGCTGKRRSHGRSDTLVRRFNRTVFCVAALFVLAGASPAFADSPSAGPRDGAKTIVIDGREYVQRTAFR